MRLLKAPLVEDVCRFILRENVPGHVRGVDWSYWKEAVAHCSYSLECLHYGARGFLCFRGLGSPFECRNPPVPFEDPVLILRSPVQSNCTGQTDP